MHEASFCAAELVELWRLLKAGRARQLYQNMDGSNRQSP
jgi:hypothetical protein